MIIVWSDKDTGKTKMANRTFIDDDEINRYYKYNRDRIESLMIVLPYSHLSRIRKMQKEENRNEKEQNESADTMETKKILH